MIYFLKFSAPLIFLFQVLFLVFDLFSWLSLLISEEGTTGIIGIYMCMLGTANLHPPL